MSHLIEQINDIKTEWISASSFRLVIPIDLWHLFQIHNQRKLFLEHLENKVGATVPAVVESHPTAEDTYDVRLTLNTCNTVKPGGDIQGHAINLAKQYLNNLLRHHEMPEAKPKMPESAADTIRKMDEAIALMKVGITTFMPNKGHDKLLSLLEVARVLIASGAETNLEVDTPEIKSAKEKDQETKQMNPTIQVIVRNGKVEKVLFDAEVPEMVRILVIDHDKGTPDITEFHTGSNDGPCGTSFDLGIFGIQITLNQGLNGMGGTIDPGQLRTDVGDPATDALLSTILAHACAGVDVQSSAYVEGIETAFDAITNQE